MTQCQLHPSPSNLKGSLTHFLENAQHLSHIVYSGHKNISHLEQAIENQTQNSPSCDYMLIHTSFSTNPLSPNLANLHILFHLYIHSFLAWQSIYISKA